MTFELYWLVAGILTFMYLALGGIARRPLDNIALSAVFGFCIGWAVWPCAMLFWLASLRDRRRKSLGDGLREAARRMPDWGRT